MSLEPEELRAMEDEFENLDEYITEVHTRWGLEKMLEYLKSKGNELKEQKEKNE